MRRYRFIPFALALLITSAPVWAGDIRVTKPERHGISTERLDRINDVFDQYVQDGAVAGVVGLVARNGRVVYHEAIGNRDTEAGDPMQPNDIFRIYSMTKPITSVAVMILFEEGKFLLTDPVERFLPELANRQILVENRDEKTGEVTYTTEPATQSITVQDLLRHTSGFVYGVAPSSELDKRYFEAGVLLEATDIQDTITKLADLPILFNPGTRWNYALNTDVLGRLVEVVSGQRFDQFLQERIFDPLGMEDTHFDLPESKRDRLAQLYTRDDSGKLEPNPGITRSYMGKPGYYSGGAGLLSTASDYWKFCQMLLNGGELNGTRLLSPKTVEFMASDHVGEVPGGFPWSPGSGFGLGFQVIDDQGAYGHLSTPDTYSWGGAAGTGFWIDPEEALVGVFMIQILPHGGLTYSAQYRNLVYQAIVEEEDDDD